MQFQIFSQDLAVGPICSECDPLIDYAVTNYLAHWQGSGGTMRLEWVDGVEIRRVDKVSVSG